MVYNLFATIFIMENIAIAYEHAPWIFSIFFFCLGACVGSFLNVCIYRIPYGKSIVRPASHCACGKPIAWYDNIPIISWFILRGKARCCGRHFSFRYAFIEFMTACIYSYLWETMAWKPALVFMFFISLLIVISYIDYDTMELSDILTIGGTLSGVLLSTLVPQIHFFDMQEYSLLWAIRGFIVSILGVLVGTGILYWIRLLSEYIFNREAMGEGDVILIGCIGAFCGWQGAIFAIFGGSIVGAFVLVPMLTIVKLFGGGRNFKGEVPFGPWLSIGALAYVVFFAPYVDAYFETLKNTFFYGI